ncbi:ATP-dependent DNA helicase RecG [Emcibacter nanhaiensis]|uniref:ATP-dependent DNA helicase RecG n=1 Tax=Emcibacter nanhaiensis TaxID=1505037 RepID=A0A501PR49_9PROT|nr:ATP-dependent DNA helicase RecG [Emcibacter nanhaiensis]TPD62597.1 ATP-dependent DNA helicase RecG [Emcibacter nanhaiensis]
MRPEILYPFFAETVSLPGVGGRIAQLLEKVVGRRVLDLCWHFPVDIIDRRNSPKLGDIRHEQMVTVEVEIGSHDAPPPRTKRPYRVWCHDDTAQMQLVFFHAKGDYLLRQLPEGEKRVISGKAEIFNGQLQMTHPDYMVAPNKRDEIPAIEPVYPLTAGISGRVMGRIVRAALERTVELPEWLDPALKKREGWPDWRAALMALHHPEAPGDVDPSCKTRRRLAYDEFLANQLALALIRRQEKRKKGRALKTEGPLVEKLIEKLPYRLTNSQQECIAEINTDLASPHSMMRLLQGDVGSGKTVVAMVAMLAAVQSGAQAALLAPTEILARQHYDSLTEMSEGLDIRIEVLTGRDKGKARERLLADLAAGEIDILVGTHALFQKDVVYHDLALAVIDEQHRFGVEQRLAVAAKGTSGQGMDMLAMTATPIPRTLTLTAYGDMDVSRLTEKPPGRLPVDTRTISLNRLDEVVRSLQRPLEGGARIYWICPLVEESEKSDLAAAEERFRQLDQIFPGRVGLVHGKMKGPEKDKVMAAFAGGALDVLVATTVIEVGVNVPEATVMVIEHAERFGLAQLHQLRGRVGRGSGQSVCLLLYGHLGSENARARMKIMRETEDGFRIAEEDLRLRGAGELLGTRQSGMPDFKVASLEFHSDLIPMARDDAKLILQTDRELKTDRGQALRVLLYLMEQDEGIRYLRSG